MPRIPFAAAVLFEIALAVAGWGVGRLFGHDSLVGLGLGEDAARRHAVSLAWGLAAAIPLIGLLLLGDRAPWPGLRRLHEYVERHLAPALAHLSLSEMAVVSLAAGLGEEILFRGLIQQGLKEWLGEPNGLWLALATTSLFFGLCHFLTPAYFVVATLISVYLGLLFEQTGDVTAPIAAHAAYDFFALWWLTRQIKRDAKSSLPAEGV